MANRVLRFRKADETAGGRLAALFELGAFVSAAVPKPTGLFDVTVDDSVSDAVANAIEMMGAAFGAAHVETDPAASLEDAARAELFGIATVHETGGDDLAVGAIADNQVLIRSGLTVVGQSKIKAASASSDTTTGTTPVVKASIVIPAEDATWEVVAAAMISHSNISGEPSAWIENATDAATLGRRMVSAMKSASNILPLYIEREFVSTVVAGAKTLELQYSVGGSGTMTISDAFLVARKVSG